MQELIPTALTAIGAGLLRNIAGWLEKSMEDGVIDKYEWGKLGATVFRVTVIGLGAAYGLGLEPVAAAGSAVVLDFIIKAIAKKE